MFTSCAGMQKHCRRKRRRKLLRLQEGIMQVVAEAKIELGKGGTVYMGEIVLLIMIWSFG